MEVEAGCRLALDRYMDELMQGMKDRLDRDDVYSREVSALVPPPQWYESSQETACLGQVFSGLDDRIEEIAFHAADQYLEQVEQQEQYLTAIQNVRSIAVDALRPSKGEPDRRSN